MQELLGEFGEVDFFKLLPILQDKDRIQAMASFVEHESAIRAVEELNGTNIKEFGDSTYVKMLRETQLMAPCNSSHNISC